MPGGNVHTTATIALAAGLGVAAYYNGLPVLPLAGGVLAGLLLTPDLDVDRGCISNKYARKAGCLVGFLWRLYWWPYSRLMPHRSALSHAPVLGTLLRLVYLLGLPLLAWWLISQAAHWPALPAWWSYPVIGLMAADGLHWAMDVLLKN